MNQLSSVIDLWIQRLRATAQTGLAFEPGAYDRERYDDMLKLAAEMAAATETYDLDASLSHEFFARWRAEVGEGVSGYVTPKVGVGAVVFNDRDEILLIQRLSGQWFYPTGWADVGYSPAQIAAKEVLEETGLSVTPQRLIAVYDIRKRAAEKNWMHFYSLVFYCRLDGGDMKRHPVETLDAGFFAREKLPENLARRELGWVELAWAAHRGELREAYFDRI